MLAAVFSVSTGATAATGTTSTSTTTTTTIHGRLVGMVGVGSRFLRLCLHLLVIVFPRQLAASGLMRDNVVAIDEATGAVAAEWQRSEQHACQPVTMP